MDSIVKTVAGAVRRGPDDPEWKFLHAYTIPDMEIRGYHLAQAIERIRTGERRLEIVAEGLDDADTKIAGEMIALLESPADIPFCSQFSVGICAALQEKDIEKMKSLLELGYPVNQPCVNSSSSTPSLVRLLHFAVQDGNREAIGLIMTYGGDPTVIDQDGDSPLLMAISRGHLDVVESFLTHQSQVGQESFDFNSCLNHVSVSGRHPLSILFSNDTTDDRRLVQLAYSKGVRFEPDMSGDHWKPVARVLTECIEQADAICRDNPLPTNSNGTAVTMASSSAGAVQSALPIWERTMRAILGMGFPVNDRLQIFTSPITALYYACTQGKQAAVRLLCEAGADVMMEGNSKGYLPIEGAMNTGGGTEGCAIELVMYGMRPDFILPLAGKTVTHMALLPKKWKDLFRVCVQRDSNSLLIPCDDGNLPMPSAAQENMLDYIAIVTQAVPNAGGILNALQPRNSMNAIGHALINTHTEMIRALLQAGASPNIRLSDNERSFLHLAILKGSMDVCRVLLEYGADVSACSKDTSTPRPLDFAINQDQDAIALLLVQKGANPFERTGVAQGSPMSIMCAGESLQERLRDAWVALGNSVPEAYLKLRPPAPKDTSTVTRNRRNSARAPVAIPVVPTPSAAPASSAPPASSSTSATTADPPPVMRSSSAEGQGHGHSEDSSLDTSSPSAAFPPPPPPSHTTTSTTTITTITTEKTIPEEKECKVCFAAEINASFVHGMTAHNRCCYDCAMQIFHSGGVCPFCNAEIDLVTRNF